MLNPGAFKIGALLWVRGHGGERSHVAATAEVPGAELARENWKPWQTVSLNPASIALVRCASVFLLARFLQ